jgi:hypothetical protein
MRALSPEDFRGIRHAVKVSMMQPSRFRVLLFAAVVAGCLGSPALRAEGVAILKEQPFHRDLTARAVVYRQIIDSGGPWVRIVTDLGNIEIGRSKLAAWIEMPGPFPGSVAEERDIAWYRQTLGLMERFAARYPRSAGLLEWEIASLRGHLARFDAGEIRVDRQWLTRSEHMRLMFSRDALAAAARKREIEQWLQGKVVADEGMTPTDPSARTALSDCLWPLIHPDAANAKLATANLESLAASGNGTRKLQAERLLAAIRNGFKAEHGLSQCMLSNAAAIAEAVRHEKHAKEWSEPNAMGTVRDEEAKLSLSKAARLRDDAAVRLEQHRAALREQLAEMDLLTADHFQQGDHRVALVLGETVRAIAARRFPDGSYEPTFPAESLEAIRAAITKP